MGEYWLIVQIFQALKCRTLSRAFFFFFFKPTSQWAVILPGISLATAVAQTQINSGSNTLEMYFSSHNSLGISLQLVLWSKWSGPGLFLSCPTALEWCFHPHSVRWFAATATIQAEEGKGGRKTYPSLEGYDPKVALMIFTHISLKST